MADTLQIFYSDPSNIIYNEDNTPNGCKVHVTAFLFAEHLIFNWPVHTNVTLSSWTSNIFDFPFRSSWQSFEHAHT